MTRARCNHCAGVFTVGEVRDCCMAGAVSEQKRLRAALAKARTDASRGQFDRAMDDVFGGYLKGMRSGQ